MSRSYESFKYSPLRLGEIRLLYVSSLANETIWSLRPIRLPPKRPEKQHEVAFDALSYTWGDLSDKSSLICNNQELMIHRNLKDALPFLAKRRSILPIWIDAICINQSDEKEKLAQIRRMHRIYSSAYQVWVWLGPDPENSTEAIDMLPRIVQVAKEEGGNPMNAVRQHPTPESKGLPSLSSPVWQGVYRLIYNPWFFRLWIVQEASLANGIRALYGSNEVDWEILREAVAFGSGLGYSLQDDQGRRLRTGDPNRHSSVFLIRKMAQDRSLDPLWQARLLNFVLLTKSHQCSSPNDRVLGVLGFVAEDQIEQIRLDDSPRLLDLYIRFGHFLLRSVNVRSIGSSWWVFLNWAATSKKVSGLPSWCPDLQLNDADDIPRNSLCAGNRHRHYSASRCTSIALQTDELHEFTVRGKVFDAVERVTILDVRAWEKALAKDVLEAPIPSEGWTTFVHDDSRSGAELPIKLTLDDYWRTLVGNVTEKDGRNITSEVFYEFRRGLDIWAMLKEKMDINSSENKLLLDECAFGAVDDPDEKSKDREALQFLNESTHLPDFLHEIAFCLERRRLFKTSKGRLGFGPKAIQQGDVICILNNAITAHILRRDKRQKRTTYRFIGEAYVHGMMNGEIETLNIEEEDFVLTA
ncbi:MAG: hypothetical protein M1822_006436 [Bathelium mastoideum]|nr:MAG: hypothetical protein M1822_006436 [Bathelium mastoideum]